VIKHHCWSDKKERYSKMLIKLPSGHQNLQNVLSQAAPCYMLQLH